ncbi:TPA: hypothetical protein PDM01_001140 [Staphylococcus aureus]|nr:hypothetical protein [Staphylococcus aureus]HDF6049660.1 hypothetical protein [Staphylococcus aureus]
MARCWRTYTALYLKLLCGEMLAHVYSVEPEILM